jgi:pimeloyl-ACP methyl ester carboxylesterase
LLSGAVAAQDNDADWIAVKGASAERVPVPVFGGRVMLYHAGKRGAPPVVLVHGLGHAAARDWAQVIPGLAASYDVYALDLPGFGLSDKGNHLYSPSNYVRVLDALAERLPKPFHLVGHSMGGLVALSYAAAYPDNVRRLVVVDVAGVLHRSVYGEFLGRAVAERALGPDSVWLEPVLRLIQTQAEGLSARSLMALEIPQVRQRLLKGDPGRIAAFALVEHDLSRALRAIRAPTLVIWSSDDKVAPLRAGETLAAVIPGARMMLIADAGHAPQVTQPQRFNALLRDELRGSLEVKPYALPPGAPAAGRSARCKGERDTAFTGDYEELVLEGCAGIEIRNARIGKLLASRSEARFVNSHLRDGVEAYESRLEFTGGSIGGDPPFSLEQSNVDLAGMRIEPRGRVVAENYGEDSATLRVSVSEIAGGKAPRYAHQILQLVADQSWTPRNR